MTAACRDSCCSVTPRLTVSELLERGLRRNRQPALAVEGIACTDAEGNAARFSLDVTDDDRIAKVGFRASPCATLIAYSELVCELATGARRELAGGLTSQDLIAALPGVHPLKQARAVLALAAFRAALAAIAQPGEGRTRAEEFDKKGE